MLRSSDWGAVLALALFCAGCASAAAPPAPSAVVVAPRAKVYSCASQATVAGLWGILPVVVQQWLSDYHQERVALGKLQGLKDAPDCSP
jgi:hypothetical protein